MLTAAIIVLPICFTVLFLAVLVHRHNYTGEPRAVRNAKAAAEIARYHTVVEFERWRQDYMLDQRAKGEAPALPMPRDD